MLNWTVDNYLNKQKALPFGNAFIILKVLGFWL